MEWHYLPLKPADYARAVEEVERLVRKSSAARLWFVRRPGREDFIFMTGEPGLSWRPSRCTEQAMGERLHQRRASAGRTWSPSPPRLAPLGAARP